MSKMLGRIKWYLEKKGYGYIIAGDDNSYYFKLVDLIDKNYIPKENDMVKFIPNFDAIDSATEVEKI